MKFVPQQRYILYTQLPISEAKERLRVALDSPKKWFYSQYDSGVYDGEIDGDEFTIFQVGSLRTPTLPDIRGRFLTSNGKTAVDVCVKLATWEKGLFGAGLGALLIGFIGSGISNWKMQHNPKVSVTFAFILLCPLLLIYVLTTITFLIRTAQSKKFLTRLLDVG